MKKRNTPEEDSARPAGSKPEQHDDTSNGSSSRRKFLTAATAVVGATGAAIAFWPFLASWQPSARARSLGAPVQIDLSKLEPGARITVMWQGKPVWVVRRTPEMLEALGHDHLLGRLRDPESEVDTQQPVYAQNELRAINPEYFVVIAICTHLGCVPLWRPNFPEERIDEDWMGGFFCPCHKSKFDLAGRVFTGVPAPTNLVIPPHWYAEPDLVEIGVEDENYLNELPS